MVFLQCDDKQIISTSPETMVKLQDGNLCTFPVGGSHPRGKTEEEDLALEKELLADEKELSEHNMLVDLARNDIGKIAKIGSVYVSDYSIIHRYSKIMHICSEVNGKIKPEYDAFDAIQAILLPEPYPVLRRFERVKLLRKWKNAHAAYTAEQLVI